MDSLTDAENLVRDFLDLVTAEDTMALDERVAFDYEGDRVSLLADLEAKLVEIEEMEFTVHTDGVYPGEDYLDVSFRWSRRQRDAATNEAAMKQGDSVFRFRKNEDGYQLVNITGDVPWL